MLKARIEKLEKDLQQLISDHREAMGEQGSHDDSNLQHHLGSALCDVQDCFTYLKFAHEPKEKAGANTQ